MRSEADSLPSSTSSTIATPKPSSHPAHQPLKVGPWEQPPALRTTVSGTLAQRGVLIPVELQLASSHSLYMSSSFGNRFEPGAIFDSLVLHLDDEDVRLSRCQLFAAPPNARADGQLIFLDDVYDCRTLLAERKLLSTRSYFQNLPLVIGQKDRIRPGFRDYTVGLLYDLSSYKKLFDEQDRRLFHESPEVRRAGQDAIRRTEGKQFLQYFDGRIEELSAMVQGFEKEDYERHGFYLRRLAWEFIASSEFLRRTNLKPRGYAGDAEMMLMAYRNEWVGETVFEQLLHKHALDTPAANAVRNRRTTIAEAVKEAREKTAGPVRIMSVACGPACELEQVYERPEDVERVQAVLLDQDRYALDYARLTTEGIGQRLGKKIPVTYVNDSVRTMLRRRGFSERLGKFHLIYTMGLFDYLTPFVAQAVLSKMYEMLEPGGSIVVGNFHVDNPTRHYMAYWMDWVLYHRTERDLLELAWPLEGATPQVRFDATGCQMFLTVQKNG